MRERPLLDRLRTAAGGLAPMTSAVVAIGAFFTLLRPFGTDRLWPGYALAFWTGMAAVGVIAGANGSRFVMSRFAAWPLAARLGVIAAIAALGVFVAQVLLQWVTGGGVTPAAWPIVFAYVFAVSIAITTFMYLLGRARAPSPATIAAPGAAFQDRLPPRLRGATLLAVESEDHYLRVHTGNGDDLILMRLSDAVRELCDVDGLRVHRSWWVARGAVADVRRADGRLTLVLSNGKEVPVSRTYARTVREAGWA
jgi:hypothetical protein